jgi:prepilin-type N-terminal cleavage/methylation domain-containing protein
MRYQVKPLSSKGNFDDFLRCNNSRGFTLIEMMTVVTIASIILLSAGSSLNAFVKRTLAQLQLQATTRQFIQDAHYARQQALHRKSFVSLMPVCVNHWDTGWMMIENAEFIASMNVADELLDRVLLERSPLASETTQLEPGLRKGNQFEDMSLKSEAVDCPPRVTNIINTIPSFSNEASRKAKHLSFNPAGSAQMKHGGMVANRLVFQSRDFPEMEQHILMGAGGRLRVCQVNQSKDCY